MADDNGFSPTSNFGKAVHASGMMNLEVPETKYNEFRENYFNQRIAPRLAPDQRQKQRDVFLKRTQRPKMPVNQYLTTLAEIPGMTLGATLDKTVGFVSPTMRKRGEALEKEVQIRKQQLDWHGKWGGGTAEFAGGSVAYGLEMEAASSVAGPIVGKIPGAAKAMAALPKALPALGRSVAFGTLMGLEAEPGKRKEGFETGFGWGVAGELIGAVAGGLWKYYKGRKKLPSPAEMDDFLKDMARGEVKQTPAAQDMDFALAETALDSNKRPGYLKEVNTSIKENTTNPLVTFRDAQGNERVSGITTKDLEKGYAQIKEAIDGGSILTHIEHDEFDTPAVNQLLAKLKENYEPWSHTPTQVATNAANKGIDAGGGTARVDNRVLKFRYATTAPSTQDAKRFIKAAIAPGEAGFDSRAQSLLRDFDTVWNPWGNWIQRSDAAAKLEGLGLTDIIPSPEIRARWKPSEGMNLPAIFNERGWYDMLDRYKMRDANGNVATLDLRQKEHLTNAMKVVWDPTIPHVSASFKASLRALTQYELNDFLPGLLNREEIGSLLTEARVGTETHGKAVAALEQARRRPPQPVKEHLYQSISRLAETIAKDKNVDEARLAQQYGKQTVDAAKNMAAIMWQRAEGDLLKVGWDEELLRQGIREGILPPVDPSGKPLSAWFDANEKHLAEQFGIDDVTSLRKASIESRVLALAEQYNVDPKNIDRELLEEVGETEIARAKEIADAAHKAGVSVYDQSVMEEAARLGKFDDTPFAPGKGVPPSELPKFEPGEPSGVPERNVRIGQETSKFKYYVKRSGSGLPSRIYATFDDLFASKHDIGGVHYAGPNSQIEKDLPKEVISDLQAIADANGIELSKTPISLVHESQALRKLGKAPIDARTVWHEDLHGMLSQLGFAKATEEGKSLRSSVGTVTKALADVWQQLPKRLQTTWEALAKHVKSEHGYPDSITGEEGFVHAASAIRFGDASTIERFAKADTDVEHVFETTQAIASQLRQNLMELAPGSGKNFAMDRLGLIESFSNIDRYKATRELAEQMFAEVGDDLHIVTDKAGNQKFDNLNRMISAVEDTLHGRLFSPNYTAWAEVAGARHAIYPSQMAPGKVAPPMPETGIEDGWHFIAPAALWEKIAPTFSVLANIDKQLNAKWSAKGAYLPLYDRAKAVDEAYRAGEAWLDGNRKSAAEFLEGGRKKLESYGFMMTRDVKEWGARAQEMHFDNDDLARLKQAYTFLRKFSEDTHLPVFDYFLNINNYRRIATGELKIDPKQASSFQRLAASGELNPKDLHLGRFINVMLREGMEKKFTGEALKGLREVIDKKVDGKPILGLMQPAVQRYHDYMRGIPDNGGKLVNGLVKSFQAGVDGAVERVNKMLPSGYKIPKTEWSGDLLRKYILLSYVGGIGGRPAIAIRDSMQGLTLSMPIIGVKTFLKGFGLAVQPEHWKLATDSGALLKGQNVGDVFGDIFSEVAPGNGWTDKAVNVASSLLAPSRWGHNFARRSVFAGVYDDAVPALKAFRKTGDVKKLLNDTGLWFADEARQKQLISLAKDKYVEPKEFARQTALEVLDLTLWPYRRGTQPGLLRTGVGRVFGQYGLWPLSYLDYIRRLTSKIGTNPKKAIPALAMVAASSYGLVEGGRRALGVDVSKWFGISPMGYAGSPHLQFMQDVFKAPEETTEGRAARKRALEYPLQEIPTWNELRVLFGKDGTWDKEWIDSDGHITQDGWKTMGFKPYKPGTPELDQVLSGDVTPEKWLEKEF